MDTYGYGHGPHDEGDILNFLHWEGQSMERHGDVEFSETSSIKSEQVSAQHSPFSVPFEEDMFAHPIQQIAQTPIENQRWEPSPQFNEDYRLAQQHLKDAVFGRTHTSAGPAPPPPHTDDYSSIIAMGPGPQPYKYMMHLGELPTRSRVETQIKCSLFLTPPTEEHLLHLPADTIARPRFQLREEIPKNPQTLYLDVDVVVPSAPSKPVYMCSKCICREKKRAFRKKTLDINEESHWNESRSRRLVILNCREIVAIPMPKRTTLPNDQSVTCRQVDLPLRLACYCRHHSAKSGYQLVFTLRDWQDNVVARTVSENIFITDNHKEPRSSMMNSTAASETSGVESGSDSKRRGSVTSMSSSASGYHPYARSNDRRNSSISSVSSLSMQPPVPANTASVPPSNGPSSGRNIVVQRAIPAQGSCRGGVEVTLLGTGFTPGLVAMFGDTPSISTQCWSDNTIIAHLPPSNVAGPVLVSFQGIQAPPHSAIFTYTNDSEVKLVELALQVVGFKMNGRIEDATDVASRIVNQEYDENGQQNGFDATMQQGLNGHVNDTQRVALQCLDFVQKKPGFVNLNLRNSEGQTMMHLSAILGYHELLVALITQGASVDIQDVSGMTPLHFATLFGQRAVTRLLLGAQADPFHRNYTGKTAIEIADSTVADLLPTDQRSYYRQLNTSSTSTLASMLSTEDLVRFNRSYRSSQMPSNLPSEGETDCTDEDSIDEDSVVSIVERVQKTAGAGPTQKDKKHEWLQFVQRLIGIKPQDFPPPYNALYPEDSASDKVVRRRAIIEMPVESDYDESAGDEDEDESEDEDEAVRDKRVIESWASNPLKQIRNDHMLFTFWIPLFVIATSYLLSKVVNTSEAVYSQWSSAGNLVNRQLNKLTHLKSDA